MIQPLRPYQREAAQAVMESVLGRLGLTFSVEISRQGGKNELSAQLEVLLLTVFMARPSNLIKCAPTFKPQTVISMLRLRDRLDDAGFSRLRASEMGYIIRLGEARAIFLSAEDSSNVVGNTAHILLEVDESQDVSRQKYSKEFRPMGAATNVTTVHYGTPWDDATLLEEVKQSNLEMEKKDGRRRHFRYDWEEVARYSPEYRNYVEAERQRLGESHPLFMTQYRLLLVHGGGGFLSAAQRAQLSGRHSRLHQPEAGKIYVAGVDLAGECPDSELLTSLHPRRDATVITIAELTWPAELPGLPPEASLRVVEHYWFDGRPHSELYGRMVDILGRVWGCRRVVVDATGLGQPVASFLRRSLGSRVKPFVFTAASKSTLGYNLLAAVNTGRLKMYTADGSAEAREFWLEMELAQSHYRPNQTLAFEVESTRGHDDFLMSLALAVEAGREGLPPRVARGARE